LLAVRGLSGCGGADLLNEARRCIHSRRCTCWLSQPALLKLPPLAALPTSLLSEPGLPAAWSGLLGGGLRAARWSGLLQPGSCCTPAAAS
jgi:hypothetical protein